MNPLVADLPNPDDVIDTVVGRTVGWGFETIADGITSWILDAVAFFVEGTVDFLLNSASPDVTAAWFSGAGSPLATMRNIAGLLLLGFFLLGLIQGLLAGDIGGMLRRMALDLPAAVIGMVATTVVVDRLLALTDALSTAVLANADSQAVHFLSGFGVTVTGLTQGFAAVLMGLMAIIAGFMVWVELMVRSVLVYVLVALSPLAFATTVWPSAKGVLRRTFEVLLALIFSKLVIAIAISVGVAALSGAGTAAPADASAADEAAAGMGTLFAGTAILGMAALSPFLLLKLFPIAEAALVAQGVSRSPVRGAQATVSNVYYAQSLARLAGGGSHGGALPAAQQAAPWAVGPGTTAPPLSIGAAGGGSGGAAAAAGGPAGLAVAAGTTVLAAGSKAAGQATRTASEVSEPAGGQNQQARPPDRQPPSSSDGGRR